MGNLAKVILPKISKVIRYQCCNSISESFVLCCAIFVVQGVGNRSLCMLGKHFTTELCPQLMRMAFNMVPMLPSRTVKAEGLFACF